MKTKKARTIDAINTLIVERYTKHREIKCPLCEIHNNNFSYCKNHCTGCPNNVGLLLAPIFTRPCIRFETYGVAHKYRLLFWQKALPIIKRLPTKAFTVNGYKHDYFRFLLAIDKEIMS